MRRDKTSFAHCLLLWAPEVSVSCCLVWCFRTVSLCLCQCSVCLCGNLTCEKPFLSEASAPHCTLQSSTHLTFQILPILRLQSLIRLTFPYPVNCKACQSWEVEFKCLSWSAAGGENLTKHVSFIKTSLLQFVSPGPFSFTILNWRQRRKVC